MFFFFFQVAATRAVAEDTFKAINKGYYPNFCFLFLRVFGRKQSFVSVHVDVPKLDSLNFNLKNSLYNMVKIISKILYLPCVQGRYQNTVWSTR